MALDITHKSNHITINRLQRRVRLTPFIALVASAADSILLMCILLFSQLYVNSRYAKPRFKKFGFEVYDTGNMYLIRTPAGLKLQWFHSTGMMVIETERSSSKMATMGLCGAAPFS